MKVQINGLLEEQLEAVIAICNMLQIECDQDGVSLNYHLDHTGIKVVYDGTKVDLFVGGQSQFVRALGIAIELINKGQQATIEEKPLYDNLSIMIDASRNAVLHKDAFEHVIRRLALMGYTSVQMYTEDTFDLENHPYFGYLRGRYSKAELKHMDEYSAKFGIELVPCIQTLAHLGTALKWQAHKDLLDYGDILLIDEPKTYELLEDMFKTMSESISSRRINIGMDEAHMMGLGKYLDKHGYQDRSALMMKHFNKVMEIARKYHYEPMMWSDMFFRLASEGEYYNPEAQISREIADKLPSDITLVYWDYYSTDRNVYDNMVKKHKQLTDKIIFAGGAWKWMGITPNNDFSKEIAELAHQSCVTYGVKEALITAWGDNGGESSIYSILPSLQVWAELCYRNSAEEDVLVSRFATCVGGSINDFLLFDTLNYVPDNPKPGRIIGNVANPSKYIFFQDIMYGLFDAHIDPVSYKAHYHSVVEQLESAMKNSGVWESLFQVHYNYAKVLKEKVALGLDIRDAYHKGDKEKLSLIATEWIPSYLQALDTFVAAYQTQWMKENKIFGLDVFDIRIGGMKQRALTAIYRIQQYVNGEVEVLEELEETLLRFDGLSQDDNKVVSAALWHLIATPSVIAGV